MEGKCERDKEESEEERDRRDNRYIKMKEKETEWRKVGR